jgi:glucose-6-phosphate 1-epimerase
MEPFSEQMTSSNAASRLVDFHGMPAVRWESRDGAWAIATLQGAQVVSWTPQRGAESLYLSERSAFEPGRAIRGGIPVVFPQFADRGSLPQHGFARTQTWLFTGARESGDSASATFVLRSSAQTLESWPHAFGLELVATVGGARLEVRLRVRNPGPDAFAFTAALHTYLRVAEAATARIEGLRGVRYMNRGSTNVEIESRAAVTAAEAIDRMYSDAPRVLHLRDAGRLVRIAQRGFSDTVVWNPGPERTAQMPDMPPEGYRRMFCVEAALVNPPMRLNGGGEWSGDQSIVIGA